MASIHQHQPLEIRTAAVRRRDRAFTLVELMVAITGGLFMSVAVFALARDGSRFYQRESRIGDATMGSVIGFERLRLDIARAGYLSSPNVRHDPQVCGNPVTDATWPKQLKKLASIAVEAGPPMPPELATQVSPDSITLASSYSSVEAFPVRNVVDTGAEYQVYLQEKSSAMWRLGYDDTKGQAACQAVLSGVFGAGRALRIVDKTGSQQYGTISGVSAATPAQPMVILSRAPVLTFRSSGAALCGFRGFETGSLANVVNFVRYDIRRLTSASYGPLYAASAGDPFDASRTELVRAELDTDGKEIAGTQELVAEYAVDLKLGITVVNSVLNATDPTLLTLAPGDANIGGWAGPTDPELAVNRGPHLVRAIRVRLGIRSREADRKEKISTEPGLFRIGLGPNGGAPFARVRTLQADIALRNQTRPTWGL